MNKIKVLLIDDNQNLVDMVKQYFSSHAVIEVSDVAFNGKDGLSLIESNKYDLVLLDLIMPGMDGVKVLEECNRKGIDTKILVLTSYNSPEVIRKVSGLGIKYFMLKPFELSDLEEKILEYSNILSSKSDNSKGFNIKYLIPKLDTLRMTSGELYEVKTMILASIFFFSHSSSNFMPSIPGIIKSS